MQVLQGKHRLAIDRLAFGPGHRLAAAVTWDAGVEVWDAAAGSCASWQACESGVTGLAYLPDGRLAVAGGAEPVQLLDAATGDRAPLGEELGNAVAAGGPALVVAAYRPDLEVGRLVGWRVGAGAPEVAWQGRDFADCRGLAASADGRRVVSAETTYLRRRDGDEPSHALVVRDGATGAEVGRVPVGLSGPAVRLAMLADGRRVAAPVLSLVRVWDADTRTVVGSVSLFAGAANDIAAHPDGRHFVTAGEDGVARVWDAATMAQVQAFEWDVGMLASVAVSPDGLMVAAGGTQGRLVVWDWDV